mmetsp:Transcript_36485/g.58763  ORF Transcript_36485/g.58763 Transcript_36485/m.58763 type:complete len:382 (-) Transcript_36485:4607-5752(-)
MTGFSRLAGLMRVGMRNGPSAGRVGGIFGADKRQGWNRVVRLFCSKSDDNVRSSVGARGRSRAGTPHAGGDIGKRRMTEEQIAKLEQKRKTREQNLDGLVHFRSLGEFLKTKKHVEHANLRQAFQANGFVLIRQLGSGSFGQVFLAKQHSTKLYRAIKVLDIRTAKKDYDFTWLTAEERAQAHLDADTIMQNIQKLPAGVVQHHMLRSYEMLQEKLRREEDPQQRRTRRPVAEHEILLRLTPHPFVSNLDSSFRDHQKLYLVFTHYEGGTLKTLLENNGGILSEDDARFYASEIALGLRFLQENNIAHRDIKPDNILLTSDGHTAISDFGLATRLHGGLKTLCGTAEYIAPEVLSSKTWTSRYLDWWAFGVMLYEMLVGKT